MLNLENTTINLSCQQFRCNSYEMDSDKSEMTLKFESERKTQEVMCPSCGKSVHVYGSNHMKLRSVPIEIGTILNVDVRYHRYRCPSCRKTFSEGIGFKHPGARITARAAKWVQELLRWHLPISSVHEITGIHWETIRNIHRQYMEHVLAGRERELHDADYRPQYLAVDEFAMHKGHSYATCVMDLANGDVLWAGRGRSKECFERFFDDIDQSYLSDVKAIAMDMNASYNNLVEKYLPHADIVYDRYHMQAQFGKDVLGAVRLAEARSHQNAARMIEEELSVEEDISRRRILRTKAREERNRYAKLKGSRWTLLANSGNLSAGNAEALSSILEEHSDLALCYAMKEEMCSLFDLSDPDEARRRWKAWFDGAKASNIPALIRFAELKEKRLEGLVAHARHNITTGKLEGFNNKIKVAKRIGYGYRDEGYFFTLIRYMAIPSVRGKSPRFP